MWRLAERTCDKGNGGEAGDRSRGRYDKLHPRGLLDGVKAQRVIERPDRGLMRGGDGDAERADDGYHADSESDFERRIAAEQSQRVARPTPVASKPRG